MKAAPIWFFDLDNTLHDAAHAIFAAIDSRMTAYVERHLDVDHAEADRIRRHYWLRYGATMLGLVRHHGGQTIAAVSHSGVLDVLYRHATGRPLNAPRAPQPGDTLAMSWTVHWSDEGGRLWRGQLVELRNASEPVRIHTWERAATWGRAVFE